MSSYTDSNVLERLARALGRALPGPDAAGCRVRAPTPGSNALYVAYSVAPRVYRQMPVRRAAWCVQNGVVPAQMPPGVVVPTCGNPDCAEHIELVSKAEQIARQAPRRTCGAAAAAARAALLASDRLGTQKELARRFGLSQPTVGRILAAATAGPTGWRR